MHFHPILLIQAESLEKAKNIAEDFCDCETGAHSYFDYGGVVPDKESQWNKPFSEIKDKLPPDNHIEEATNLINEGTKFLNNKDYGMAGYSFRKAGQLLEESFCTEHATFNVQMNDYSHDCGEGWYAIEADLHY